MHCAGNDFMVIDGINQIVTLPPLQIQRWAHRYFSIGFLRLLIVEKPENSANDFKFRILDTNAEEVHFNGNDICCLMRFMQIKNLTSKQDILVETTRGVISPKYNADHSTDVDMGEALLSPPQIPFKAKAEAITYPIEVEGQPLNISCLNIAKKPYAVLTTDDLFCDPITQLSSKIAACDAFVRKTNIIFLQIVSYCEISLREFEPDGTELYPSACAVSAATIAGSRLSELTDSSITAYTQGGEYKAYWQDQHCSVTGSAVVVYEGEASYG